MTPAATTRKPAHPAPGPERTDHDVDALARLACAGDRAAFDQLAEQLRPRLVRILQQKLRRHADAQDTAQAALLRWWQKRDAYDPARPFMPWLITLTLRLATDTQRAGARRKHHEQAAALNPADADTNAQGLQNLEQHERHHAVWATVRQTLGHDAATALWLFYGEAMPLKEIAAVLNKRPGAVRTMLHRGRAALRPHLKNWNPHPPTHDNPAPGAAS